MRLIRGSTEKIDGDERRGGVRGQRPEHARALRSSRGSRMTDASHRTPVTGQQRLGRRKSKTAARAANASSAVVRRAFEALRVVGRPDDRHHARAVIARVRRRKDVFGPQRSQTSEIARLTDPLIARPARQAGYFHRFGRQPRVAPRRRPRGFCRSINPTIGVAVVAAMCSGPVSPPTNNRLRSISARSSARSNSPKSTTRSAATAERLPRRCRDAARRLTIRRPRAEHDPPRRRRAREARDQCRESRLRPAPERIAGARRATTISSCSGATPASRRRRGDPRRRRRVRRHLDRVAVRRSGAPAGHPGIASSRSHWFTTECRRPQRPRPRHRPRVHPRAPLDLVADSRRAPRSPAPARRCADRRADRSPGRTVACRSRRASRKIAARRASPAASAPRSPRPGADCRATTGAAAGSTRYARRAAGNARFNARGSGVVNTTSPMSRSRISRMFNWFPGFPGPRSRFTPQRRRPNRTERGSCYSIVASSISMTGMSSLMGYTRLHCGALQRSAVLDELDLRLAVRAGQDFEQFRIDGHRVFLRSLGRSSPGGLCSDRSTSAHTIAEQIDALARTGLYHPRLRPESSEVIIVSQMRSFLPDLILVVLPWRVTPSAAPNRSRRPRPPDHRRVLLPARAAPGRTARRWTRRLPR